ncbi:hypothetical protein V1525DRAFT_455623 [Lipomyces kononenkoae]|uniref:Uncharacterized protein n=1 Tax=Lipomyces kononenkoae TaxID=34357 RepID=A0ACC3T477_LIPKO
MPAVYHACYIDYRVRCPALLTANVLASAITCEHSLVAHNLTQIVSVFKQATSYSSEAACLEHLATIDPATQVVLFIDMPSREPALSHVAEVALDGPTFLERIRKTSSLRRRLFPVALVDDEEAEMAFYVELGAIDVINRMVQEARIRGIMVQLYRDTYRSLPNGASKAGWIGGSVGTSLAAESEEQLIESLFNVMFFDKSLAADEQSIVAPVLIARESEAYLQSIIGDWDFPVDELTDDELTQCAYYIFQHSFTMPEVQHLILSPDGLQHFISVLRASYQSQNPYHNFRHVVDVLQATFSFLLAMQALPPYTKSTQPQQPQAIRSESSLSGILDPIDALALLVTAMGHDVGHPGVTNAFLIASRSPLARIYSERSVLESFHCAAFSQILARHWPLMMEKNIKELIVDAVLATDMALHFDYMQKFDRIFRHSNGLVTNDEMENARMKTLLCSMLIKCADISNVARRLDISKYWGTALSMEFKKMSDLEEELGLKPPAITQPDKRSTMPTNVLSQDDKESVALAKSQLFFITTFAEPLFDAVQQVVPELRHIASNIAKNRVAWTSLVS